ncbi:MAG: hypothetical protein ACYC8T_12175 [Myxococcaceae bacterium]
MNGPGSSSRALSLGAKQALSLWPAALAVFGCGAAEVLAGLIATVGVLEWLTGSSQVGQAALGAALSAWLAARILRALAEGGAIRQGAERMTGRGFLPLAAEAVRAAPRSLSFLAWSLPLELLYAGWRTLALIATLGAYFQALGTKQTGVLSSAALALFLTLSIPVAIAWALWGRVAFVRAVRRDEGVLISLYQAAGELWRRPWPRVIVLFATGAAAVAAELVLGGFVNALSSSQPEPSLRLALAGQVVGGILVAYVASLVELARLQALLALELGDEGTLPVPRPPSPPPAPIVDAEIVVDAQPVPPGA